MLQETNLTHAINSVAQSAYNSECFNKINLEDGSTIDIKVSHPIIKKSGNRFWIFDPVGNEEAHYYLAVGLDDNNIASKIFLIPKEEVPKKQVSINIDNAHKSKFARYLIKTQ